MVYQPQLSCSYMPMSLILMTTKCGQSQVHTHLIEEEAEAERWTVTCPRSPVQEVHGPELDPCSWIAESPSGPLWPWVLGDQKRGGEGA